MSEIFSMKIIIAAKKIFIIPIHFIETTEISRRKLTIAPKGRSLVRIVVTYL